MLAFVLGGGDSGGVLTFVLGGGGGGAVVGCVGGGGGGEVLDAAVVFSDDVTDGDVESERDGDGLTAGFVLRGATEDGTGCARCVTGAAGDGATTGTAAGEDTSGAWLARTAVPRDAGADGAAAPS